MVAPSNLVGVAMLLVLVAAVFLVLGSTAGRGADWLFGQPRKDDGRFDLNRQSKLEGVGGLMIVLALALVFIAIGSVL